MKNLLFLFAGLLMACNGSQKAVNENSAGAPKKPDPVAFAASITEEELKEHLYTYASDEFEGRETGKEGQKKAVAYLKAAYESMEIPGGLQGGDYFQDVPLELTKLPTGNLFVDGQSHANGEGFLTFGGSSRSYDEIVYVGYGIETEEYSDYQGLDVKGKLLMMKAGEPRNGDGTFLLTGTQEPSKWSNISEAIEKRMEVALEKGAGGILFVDPDNFSRYMRYFDYMKTNDSGQMSLKDGDEETPDMLLVSEELAGKIYDGYGSSEKPATISLPVRMEVESRNEDVASENVVAFIRGSEWPGEYVVISSHLDHIGVNANGEINNGADDDGSGTVALLEIAEAFKQAADAGMGPRRSVVFLHVTGEEKGLLGSRYYTDVEPVFPLENTVANLNIDMIGRIDPKREGNRNYVYLIGSDKLSSELHELSETVNARYTGIELDYTYNDENDPNRFYYRSDHYNFAKNNIPIIFYFNGTHADYHRPGDTPDKINYDLLKNRTQLVFHTAWEIANRDGRLVVDQVAR
ncbi:M28 family peptidase [Robiginitalea marina]|uniref:M28 family peptidase n=1 Tax=Robiginitalea marina TaxID=2954105 RepID=A0ABT1ATU6_9FLAO|nr:M28 family peptidase [Robiginitalea marina]MCO5723393.1 M28 family peptidase [Robiginitalea marina]